MGKKENKEFDLSNLDLSTMSAAQLAQLQKALAGETQRLEDAKHDERIELLNSVNTLFSESNFFSEKALAVTKLARDFIETGIDRSKVNSLEDLAELVKSGPLANPEKSNMIDYKVGEETFSLVIRPKIQRKTKAEKAAAEKATSR
jgi:hypothetical protein